MWFPSSSLPPSHQIPPCPLGCHQLQLSPGPTCPTLGRAPQIDLETRPSTEAGGPARATCQRGMSPMALYHPNNSCCQPFSLSVIFHLQNWCAWPLFPLAAFPESSCPLQGCPRVCLPPSLPLLLGLLCISNGFGKFCTIVFLVPRPFFLPMPHTSNRSCLSFFRKSDIRKVSAAPGGREALGGRSGRSCDLCCIPFSSSSCREAEGDPHLSPSPAALQLHLVPRAPPTACRDTRVAPVELPRRLRNLKGPFCRRGLDPGILPHATGNLTLKWVGGGGGSPEAACVEEGGGLTNQSRTMFFCLYDL